MSTNKEKIYDLPWKCNNNPQCFLEITRACKVGCSSCYQRNGFLGQKHKPLSLIKEEVDIFINALYPSAICIVGGEPTENPELPQVVKYIKSKNVLPVLFTHTYNLNEENLKRMVEQGLAAIYAHIDEQTGHHMKGDATESDMMEYRDRLAELLRPYHGQIYGMISAILSDNNFNEAVKIQKWAYDNSDIIKYCVFTLDGYKLGKSTKRKALDVVMKMRSAWPNFTLNSCLRGTASNEIRWGQAVTWVNKDEPKFLNYKLVSFLDKAHYAIFKKHTTILRPKILSLLPSLFTTVIVRPHEQGTIDFCAGCPDQTIVWVKQGRNKFPILVHSCLSQDFILKGYSNEEHELNKKLKGQIDKHKALCGHDDIYYSKDMEIIKDWRIATKYLTNSNHLRKAQSL